MSLASLPYRLVHGRPMSYRHPRCLPGHAEQLVTMSETNKAWLQIHFCVLLWGFTAILGKLISMSALPLVLWRMLLVAAMLLCAPRVWRSMATLSRRHLLAFSGVGILVAIHWLGFYGAVKFANASVAATCMAMVPVFVCVIEPLVTGRAFVMRELWLGVFAIPGIALVVGGTPDEMNIGVLVGIISAFFAALFGAYNKRLIHRTDALSATALEMLSGGIFVAALGGILVLLAPMTGANALWPEASEMFSLPGATDLSYLLGLAVLCTLLPFSLSLRALRHLSAYASAFAVNLEPIYAIILAVIILGEQRELGAAFYVGAAMILSLVFAYPLVVKVRVPNVVPQG